MVLSQYLIQYPYRAIWHGLRTLKKNPKVVFYCADYLDYVVFGPVQKVLPSIPVVAKSKRVQHELRKHNIVCSLWPAFPEAVIMARHALHKFPEPGIVKIGLRHGAYHFKEFIKAKRYNAFDLYLMTSQKEVELAEKMGIHVAKVVGFPKLDPAFDGSYSKKCLDALRNKIAFNPQKPILIFSATWDQSGMSAIDKWCKQLGELTDHYNILVTVHPWTSKHFVNIIKQTPKVYFIPDKNVLPYLMLADIMIADTSSIIAESCALNKPIITFKVPGSSRSTPEVRRIIADISIQIDNFEEIHNAIKQCLEKPNEKSDQRRRANKTFFLKLDGKAGKRAAIEIKKLLKERNIF